jgi:transposase
MSRSKHTEAQMIAAVKQMEAGRKAEDVAREVGVSAHTIYGWKSKYGGMDVSEAQEAKRRRGHRTPAVSAREGGPASVIFSFHRVQPPDIPQGDSCLKLC